MFDIKQGEQGEVILIGRLDASKIEKASEVFDAIREPSVVDFGELDYISSIGLGLLIKTQKRLTASVGEGLRLVNVNRHISDIFRYSGFHQIFDIEAAPK